MRSTTLATAEDELTILDPRTGAPVEASGGRVSILDYVAERSTTAMVQRIRNGEGASVSEA